MASFSQSVDNKIATMSEGLLSKFSQMFGQFKIDMSNSSFQYTYLNDLYIAQIPQSREVITTKNKIFDY